MAKFTFQLEPLLRHRRQIEEEQQRKLAQFLREKAAIENDLRRQQQAIGEDKRTLSGSLVGHVDVDRIRRHAAHVNRATLGAQQAAIRLGVLHQQIAAARDELSEAVRQRKAIEVLRERQYEQWQQDENRREAAMADELAVQQYARRAGGGEVA